jgi:HPt (histidine-containing phosphotransfer) domain-containing protein
MDAAVTPLPSTLPATSRLRGLIGTFLASLEEDVATMEACLREEDLLGLATQAHQVKGSAGMYGYPTITAAAAELEERVNANAALDDVRAGVRSLIDLCRQARAGQPT